MDKIRPADISNNKDVKDIQRIYTPYVNDTPVTFEYHVPNILNLKSRIAEINKSYPFLVFERDLDVVAYAYASAFRSREAYQWTCELSVYVSNACHGQGIGRALYDELISILARQNIKIAYAVVTTPNPQSEHFHLRYGFSKVGVLKNSGFKLGKWWDVTYMEKVVGSFDIPPAPFIPIKNLENFPG